jgi:1-acyl-sn-glycerol-3-phosphate acyltransferase
MHVLNVFRSAIFNLFYALWMPFIGIILFIPSLFIPRIATHGVGRSWAAGVIFMLRIICGIRFEIKGKEYLKREGAMLYAVKHQSAWETVMFWLLVDTPVYVLKKELLSMPVFGYYLKHKIACIAVDRNAGTSAIRKLITGAKEHLAAARQIIIFPEGTRRAVGAQPDYQPGIAAMYAMLNVPVTPVAHNAGVFWPRNAFIKKSGVITIEFLPPIEAGLEREIFMTRLQDSIEQSSNQPIVNTGK